MLKDHARLGIRSGSGISRDRLGDYGWLVRPSVGELHVPDQRNTARLTQGQPAKVPGDWVTFSCVGGKITVNGAVYCNNQAGSTHLMCGSGICSQTIVGSVVTPGLTFNKWSSSGDATITCNSCITTTLSESVPNPSLYYSGTVQLLLYSHTSVQVTIHTFSNWSTGWQAGAVQICQTPCTTYSNGQVASLSTNYSYTISSANLPSGYHSNQWTTTAGTLSSSTNDPTSIFITQGGVLSLFVRSPTSNWVGYIYSPPANGTSISSVSGQLVVPDPPPPSGWSFAYWVGIGGISDTTNLWQAGIVVNGTGVFAWWEKIGPGCPGCAPTYNPTMVISPFDVVKITLTTSGGTSSFSIFDQTTNTTWSGNQQFSPYAQSAEWVAEPGSVGTTLPTNFTTLNVDGSPASFVGNYLVVWAANGTTGLLELSGGYPMFHII